MPLNHTDYFDRALSRRWNDGIDASAKFVRTGRRTENTPALDTFHTGCAAKCAQSIFMGVMRNEADNERISLMAKMEQGTTDTEAAVRSHQNFLWQAKHVPLWLRGGVREQIGDTILHLLERLDAKDSVFDWANIETPHTVSRLALAPLMLEWHDPLHHEIEHEKPDRDAVRDMHRKHTQWRQVWIERVCDAMHCSDSAERMRILIRGASIDATINGIQDQFAMSVYAEIPDLEYEPMPLLEGDDLGGNSDAFAA